MYYQILIETTEKVDESDVNKQYFELDRSSLEDIEANIVLPYLRKAEFLFSGRMLKFIEIKRILIKETNQTTYELSLQESARAPHNTTQISAIDILNYKEHVRDITTTVFNRMLSVILANKNTTLTQVVKKVDHAKVMLVHGRDHLARDIAVNFLAKIGITDILLHEHIRGEKSIIEKLEGNVNIGFAIILYTPTGLELKPRAQQHIIFEHGYLTAKLGRRKVCALIKSNVETPLQCHGLIYIPLDVQNTWHQTIATELTRAGYQIDTSKIKTTETKLIR